MYAEEIHNKHLAAESLISQKSSALEISVDKAEHWYQEVFHLIPVKA